MVQVGPGRAGDFAVRVLESPAGQGEGIFHPPWSPGEWGRIRAGMARLGRHLEIEAPSFPQPSPQGIGEELFRALFSGQVGLLWARSAGAVPDRGLRLQLRFKLDGEPPGSSLLHSLPWELLHQPDTRDFLALSRLTPVVRYLEVPRPVSPFRRPAVLRILVVISTPTGLPPLDIARERREIQEAWGSGSEVEVSFLERPRAEALREALLRRSYHILHFIGHGELDRRSGEGRLFFEAPDGTPDPVSGEALATLLKDLTSLRLVFLNACETAQALGEDGLDPFAGMATALVMAGLPAVVAMQLPISDAAAIAFSRAVHLRLAAGDPADTAVTEGRQAIYAAHPTSMEWAIPVLFTRVADGRIFDRKGPRIREAPPPAPPQLRRTRKRPWQWRTALAAGFALTILVAVALIFHEWGAMDRILTVFSSRPAGKPKMAMVRVGALRVGQYEVTQGEFLQFVQANPQWRRDRVAPGFRDGGYLKSWISPDRIPPALDDYPATSISWYAAEAFCEWIGGRLPNREEWQSVAHMAEHRFPWGPDQPARPPLNFCDRVCPRKHRGIGPGLLEDGFPETAPVGSFPAGRTREGVFDLSGNVWEWTADASGTQRVTLGGSYLSQFDECSTDVPVWEEATLCAPDGGFRCVWK